jgi:TonB-dependent receptor
MRVRKQNKVSSPAMFKRKALTTAVVAAIGSGICFPATAQDSITEEVVVTGIRGSLQRSMDIKRDSNGVVDAISAEDMGKFPDTNLAESLQRITGVSINRVNGEGSRITVRGFGGDENMITLNGRQVPGGVLFGGGGAGTIGGTRRAFDFSTLASESISGVEVFKTGRADVTSGGIGSTVNIKTSRPLDSDGFQASIGGKGMYDDSAEDPTFSPEYSGIISFNQEDKVGVSFATSYQERESGFAGGSVNDWNIRTWDGVSNQFSMAGGGVVENAPDVGQLYARPNDLRYEISSGYRERTNRLLTIQIAPSDTLMLTGDYMYAENIREEDRSETTLWMANQNTVTRVVFDDSPVATPIFIEELVSDKDNGQEQTQRSQKTKLTSMGFNAEWAPSDSFRLNFDVSSSEQTSRPYGRGGVGEIAFTMALGNLNGQTWDYSKDLPLYTMSIGDSAPTSKGNHNGIADVGDVGSQILRTWSQWQKTEVDQLKIEGEWEFGGGKFQFGVERKTMDLLRQSSGQRYMAMGDWGVGYPGDIPDELISQYHWGNFFNDFNTNDMFVSRGDAFELATWASNSAVVPVTPPYDLLDYPDGSVHFDNSGFQIAPNTPLANDDDVREESEALYLQYQRSDEIAGMETNLVAGVRYESTDVEANSRLRPPPYLIWQDNNDFATATPGSSATVNTITSDYDHVLPSLDFDIMLTEGLKARASFSKTMARASINDMYPSVSQFGRVGSTYIGTIATASRGNPALEPLESTNIDLSLEWYFGDSSYASIGYFDKDVKNFIGRDQVDEPQVGILDQTNGPRVMQAAALLNGLGVSINDTSLFAMTVLVDNPADFPDPVAAFQTDAGNPSIVDNAWAASIAAAYDVIPEAGDPAMIFRTQIPVNNREANIDGWEIAVQHFFGETGFGVAANYTIVDGDVGYDDTADPGVSQFALTGLSDTANVVLMYENFNWQARLAWNWRDEYLDNPSRGNSRNPIYVEEYDQFDLNVSYLFSDNLVFSFEALNITGSDIRQFGRSDRQMWFVNDLSPRYTLGARYKF